MTKQVFTFFKLKFYAVVTALMSSVPKISFPVTYTSILSKPIEIQTNI